MAGQDQNNSDIIERLVGVRRVAKTTKGGRNMSFAALIVVGDGKGRVGIGYAKAREVPSAATKARQVAMKAMFDVPRIQGTIPHPVQGEDAAGVVFLRPASPGTGVIAGGPVRAVLECAGYTDVLTKSLGSSNSINIVHATIAALKELERPESVAARRGLPLEDVAPPRLRQNLATDSVRETDKVEVEKVEDSAPVTNVKSAEVADTIEESATTSDAKTASETDETSAPTEDVTPEIPSKQTKEDVKKPTKKVATTTAKRSATKAAPKKASTAKATTAKKKEAK